MSGSIPTPHDAVFRAILGHPDSARDFLEIHLPPELREQCDLSTLRLASGSFLDDDLRAYCSDVLYSLSTSSGEGYVYCLVEHQSSPDRHMAFRLLRYAIAAMQQHLKAGHDTLPLVIPLLFYHGERSPYPYSMNWLDGFADHGLAAKLYSGDFPLIDITVTPDDDIMQHRRVAMLELLLKHARQRDLAELIDLIATLLMSGYTEESQIRTMLYYMLQVGETGDPDTLLRGLASRVPEKGEALMTIAEQLEARGMLKGRQEGEECRALQVARNMIERTAMDDRMIAELSGLDIEQVHRLRAEAGR